MAEEGYNLAFIFNSGTGAGDCPRGLSCISSDLGNIIVAGFEKTLKTELPLYEKYSLEEFELLRQSLHERHIQVRPQHCDLCQNIFCQGCQRHEGIHGN